MAWNGNYKQRRWDHTPASVCWLVSGSYLCPNHLPQRLILTHHSLLFTFGSWVDAFCDVQVHRRWKTACGGHSEGLVAGRTASLLSHWSIDVTWPRNLSQSLISTHGVFYSPSLPKLVHFLTYKCIEHVKGCVEAAQRDLRAESSVCTPAASQHHSSMTSR